MKKTLIKILGAAAITLTFNTLPAWADEQKTTTTVTTSSGTISDFGPERIVVHSETEKEPLTYSYTKTTTYVDEDGNPVAVETVKSGAPVTIHYSKVGDRLVASKVIVRKTVTKTEK
jgi:hypothetical protein